MNDSRFTSKLGLLASAVLLGLGTAGAATAQYRW